MKKPDIVIETIPEGVDPEEFLRQAVHDCPECRAALAAGEQPIFGTHDDLLAAMRGAPKRFRRPPRWRTRKSKR